ncbi:hypothetical protein [Streptomyces rhizosphaerihabitans]|uniref:hypothetical protein n=1 Tax=Streptomyces rhizosphaerihabitans TaxID=1266770 RepID=UPI0021BEC68A|nr:hypothetical protein [Streptomyces rhizosphaerihabitans]MCT9004594.1 hypothetical protein [Streptomyces rhizosphaerihabitans]
MTQKFGIGSAETLRNWFRRDEIDSGQRPGTTTEESAAMKTLKKETAELKRANEILRAAALGLVRPIMSGYSALRLGDDGQPKVIDAVEVLCLDFDG